MTSTRFAAFVVCLCLAIAGFRYVGLANPYSDVAVTGTERVALLYTLLVSIIMMAWSMRAALRENRLRGPERWMLIPGAVITLVAAATIVIAGIPSALDFDAGMTIGGATMVAAVIGAAANFCN